jgi:hypothetical protein
MRFAGSAVQIAYHVPDPERAALDFSRRFGWGPFFYFEHIALSRCRYRGQPAAFDHSSAYGQAGELMVELITQHDDAPSVLRDLYARDAVGIHHVAHFVQSLPDAMDDARRADVDIALDACTSTGTAFVMLDLTRQLGHMIEIYEGCGDLMKFYRYVRRAADGWDGTAPLRRLNA